MAEQVSFIKACREFFSTPPHGRQVSIEELKNLTYEDRCELREMLIGVGYDVVPINKPAPTT